MGLGTRGCDSVAATGKRISHDADAWEDADSTVDTISFSFPCSLNAPLDSFLPALLDKILEDFRKTVCERRTSGRFRAERRKGMVTRRTRACARRSRVVICQRRCRSGGRGTGRAGRAGRCLTPLLLLSIRFGKIEDRLPELRDLSIKARRSALLALGGRSGAEDDGRCGQRWLLGTRRSSPQT